MAQNDKGNLLPVLAGGGAGALLAILLNPRPASAAPNDQPIHLDEETMATLIGILQSIQEANEKIEAILAALGVGGSTNPANLIIDVMFPQAIGVAKQLVSYNVPPNMKLLVKALPTNAGVIQLGYSKVSAESPLASYPLVRNEPITFKVARADAIWMCSPTALTDGIVMTAEQI